jgi:hypothetical protein
MIRPRFLTILVLLASLFAAGISNGQDLVPQAAAPRAPLIPPGEVEVRIAEINKIPSYLMAAIKSEGCILEHVLPEIPVHIFRADTNGSNRIVALIPCAGFGAFSRAFIFYNQWRQPNPMVFPIVEYEQGIGMTFTPGLMEWNARDQLLVATKTSDMCPDMWLRYTYRFDHKAEHRKRPVSWILLKAEAAQNACEGKHEGWVSFFEAPALPAREPPRNVLRQ